MHEEHLISLLRQKDQSAFSELVELYSSRVYNTSLGILQNAEDAEDVSQEVFIEVFQSIHLFRGEAKFSTWIYRITVSKSLELIRKKKRKKRFAFIQGLFGNETGFEKEPTHFYHPGVQLENKERSAILFKAIDKLPDKQKTAFILHKIESMSYAEITEVMNISLSSVESLMFRAKQNLQKLLTDYYEENER